MKTAQRWNYPQGTALVFYSEALNRSALQNFLQIVMGQAANRQCLDSRADLQEECAAWQGRESHTELSLLILRRQVANVIARGDSTLACLTFGLHSSKWALSFYTKNVLLPLLNRILLWD